jgi:hypothetical protein
MNKSFTNGFGIINKSMSERAKESQRTMPDTYFSNTETIKRK